MKKPLDYLSDIFVRETAAAFILRVAGIGFSFLFTFIASWKLGPAAVGKFALCFTLVDIGSLVGRFGFDTTLLRFSSDLFARGEMGKLKTLYTQTFKFVLPLALALSAALLIGHRGVAEHIFHKPQMTAAVLFAAFIIVPHLAVFMNSETLRSMNRTREYVLFSNVLIYAVGCAVLFGLTLNSTDDMLPVYAYCAAMAVLAVGSWARIYGLLGKVKSVLVQEYSVPKLAALSYPMLFASSLAMIMSWTDILMLGYFATEEQIGIYNVAMKVAMGTSVILYSVNTISTPIFAKNFGAGDMDEFRASVQKTARLLFVLCVPAFGVLVLCPKFILGLFGPEFRVGSTALLLLLCGQFFNSISGSTINILRMTGHLKAIQTVMFFSMLVKIPLNFMLIPRMGIEGAAFTSMLCMVLWNAVFIYYIKKNFQVWSIIMPVRKKT